MIKNYKKVESLEEAYELNQNKFNSIVAGNLWLRLSKQNITTAIDLSGLGLDQIEESEEEFKIGCMVSLRQLETHAGMAEYTKGAMKEALRHIVGVQFRNLATVGGSIYGRFGFSDVLTIFLAMDSYVELYKGGIVPLKDFVNMPKDNDILVRVIVKKSNLKLVYQSVRNTKTDFPTLTCCVADWDGEWKVSVGARPQMAMLVPINEDLAKGLTKENIESFAKYVEETVPMRDNMRGSARYRSHLAKVLVTRTLTEIGNIN